MSLDIVPVSICILNLIHVMSGDFLKTKVHKNIVSEMSSKCQFVDMNYLKTVCNDIAR